MQPYTTEILSANRSYTPDGFLLCANVTIGRTGVQVYRNGELGTDTDGNPIAGPNGTVRVTRDAADVFAPEALASFQGKPVTVLHPPKLVGPADYQKYAKGTVLNPRRGEGDKHDALVADLLITDKPTMDALTPGTNPEVSSGYDAAYVKTGIGEYKQISIVGNHVAAVPKGRCGPRCAIGDHAMPKQTLGEWFASKLGAAKTPEEIAAVMTADMDGAGEAAPVTVNVTGVPQATFDALQAQLTEANAKIAQLTADADKDDKDEETEEEKAARLKKEKEKEGTTDAAPVVVDMGALAAFQSTLAFLAPTVKMPTLDAAADPQGTLDAVCSCKRDALAAVATTPNGKAVLEKILPAGADIATMDAGLLDSAFFQTAGAMRTLNNGLTAKLATATADGKALTESEQLAAINAANRARYATPNA